MKPTTEKNETGAATASPLRPAPVEPAEQAIGSESLLAVIERAATNPAVDVGKMERLLEMHERIIARLAEAAFNDAMRLAQSEMPRIEKDATNPSTNSKYTRLETLIQAIAPIYTRNGFSLSFGTGETQLPEHYRITCVVSHCGVPEQHIPGHSRNYQADLPIDYLGMKGSPNKTKTHGFGSTLSYGRRYLTLLIFNIALVGEDKDGVTGRIKPPGPSQMHGDKPPTHDDAANKRKLVDLLHRVHGCPGYALDDAGKAKLTQWLIDEMVIADNETVADLAGEKLAAAVVKVEGKLKAG
jgi:hypothetical protein